MDSRIGQLQTEMRNELFYKMQQMINDSNIVETISWSQQYLHESPGKEPKFTINRDNLYINGRHPSDLNDDTWTKEYSEFVNMLGHKDDEDLLFMFGAGKRVTISENGIETESLWDTPIY